MILSPCKPQKFSSSLGLWLNGHRLIITYNLCQKSWSTYVISGDHLVMPPSPPQNNVDVYSVDRYRNGHYACRHFSDKQTLNSTLFLGGGDFNHVI